MDRSIVYTQEQARSTDFLFAQRAGMIGLSKLIEAVYGTSTLVSGLSVVPTSPASLSVWVNPGQIFMVEPVDATAYGVLAADTAHSIVKQGLLMDQATLSCPAPGTAGYSINYLIQATLQENDTTNVVLPYFNSANPSAPLSGQTNSGVAQATERQDVCIVAVKAGAAATTGTQTTPAPDAGYVGLAVVTVANGATTIIAGNIVIYGSAPYITETLTQKISQATGDTRYALIGASSSIQGAFKNLQSSATGTTAVVSFSADELTVENPTTHAYTTLRALSLSASTGAASGAANSLDTGAWAFSTWYAQYVIYNGTTAALLWSLSATAPTLPSGYTSFARVGWIKTQSATSYSPLAFTQFGRDVQYKVLASSNVPSFPIMASGSAGSTSTPTWVAIGVSGSVPSTASKIHILSLSGPTALAEMIVAPNDAYGNYLSVSNPPPIAVSSNTGANSAQYKASQKCSLILESANIYWASNDATNRVFCIGWEDNL